MSRWLLAVMLSLFVLSLTAWAADDPQLGTWKLNLAKSKFSPGPAPKSEILKWEASGNDAVKSTSEIVDAQGKTTKGGYTASYDGKDTPWAGNPDADTVSLKRIDPNTIEATWKKGGKVTNTSRRVVSKDGKTMTITQKGTDAKGQAVNNVIVLDKQ